MASIYGKLEIHEEDGATLCSIDMGGPIITCLNPYEVFANDKPSLFAEGEVIAENTAKKIMKMWNKQI